MLSYFYNSYIYEVCHNYFQIIKDSLWNTPRTLTYSSHLATAKQYQSIQMNPAFVPPVYHLKPKVNHKKLETILEEDESTNYSNLTNFYFLSLFRESATTWSIHGLWPQTDAHNYPTYCHPVTFDPNLLEPILDKLEQYWYSQGNTLPLDEKFWKHEYAKHGSCVYTPMTELEYFQNTINLYEKALELDLPNTFYNPQTQKCLIPVNQKLEFIPPSN